LYCFLLSVLGLYLVFSQGGVGLLDTISTTKVFQIFILFISYIVLRAYFYFAVVSHELKVFIYYKAKFIFHAFIFHSGLKLNIMVEQIKELEYYFLLYIKYIIESNKENKSFVAPCIYDLYPLLYSIFTLSIVPLFYFNIYILTLQENGTSDYFNISNLAVSFLWSLSGYYLITVIALNIYYKNNNNTYKIILQLLCLFSVCKIPTKFKIKFLFLIIFLLLSFVGINILILNMFIFFLDINTNSLILYIYIRINLLPFMLYINNIIIAKGTNYLSDNISRIDYSLFSINMLKSITLSRLFAMTGFICLFAFLSPNIDDFLLKMNNPNTGGNNGGNPGSGPGSGPGPGPGPGSGWTSINLGGDHRGNLRWNPRPVWNSATDVNPVNPEPTDTAPDVDPVNTGGNLHADLDTIKAKIRWRADHVIHRNAPIYRTIQNNDYDCNLTEDEIIFLNRKVEDLGLDNSRPFAVYQWQSGVNKGKSRIVRLQGNNSYPVAGNNCPVRATVEFKRFLNRLS